MLRFCAFCRNGLIFSFIALTVFANAAVIRISSLNDLRSIGEGKAGFPLSGDYELTADIDASASKRDAFVPIGTSAKPFTGKFNGNGHAIYNMYISSSSGGHVGVFGYIGPAGRVSNVGVVDADISGSFAVGTLAGTNAGSILNSYSSGSVYASRQESNAGGLVGVNGGTVEKSYSAASVKGKDNIGGLAGFLTVISDGVINECYATGGVSGNNAVGGLVGYVFGGSITKSFSMGAVSGKTGAGGLVGVEFSTANPKYNVIGQVNGSGGFVKPANIVNCFWDIETSGMATSAGAGKGGSVGGSSGKTTQEMRQQKTYTDAGWNLNGSDGWEMQAGQPYPQIKSEYIPDYTIIYKAGSNGSLRLAGSSEASPEYSFTLSVALATPKITAVANGGYRFSSWSDGDTNRTRTDVSAGNITLVARFAVEDYSPPIPNPPDTANPSDTGSPPVAPKKYTLTYETLGSGRIAVDGGSPTARYSREFTENTPGPAVAPIPDDGYYFYDWSDGYPDSVRTDVAQKNMTVYARFSRIITPPTPTDPTTPTDPNGNGGKTTNYTLSYEAVGNGRLIIDGKNVTASHKATVASGSAGPTVAPTPNSGYRFLNWSDGHPDSARKDIATKDIAVLARFAQITTAPTDPTGTTPETAKYTLYYEAIGNGNLFRGDSTNKLHSSIEAKNVSSGTAGPKITAVPNEGYRFSDWSDGHSDSVRIDVAQKDITAYARFSRISVNPTDPSDPSDPNGGGKTTKYTLSYEAVGNGRLIRDDTDVDVIHKITVDSGSAGPTIAPTPNKNYRFLNWSDGYPDSARKDVAVKSISVFARFALITTTPNPTDPADPNGGDTPTTPKKYTFNYEAIGNGTLTSNGVSVSNPYEITNIDENTAGPKITAVPNPGYFFVRWSDGVTDAARKDVAEKNINVFARFGAGSGADAPNPETLSYKLRYKTDGNGWLKITAIADGTVRNMPQFDTTLFYGERTGLIVTAAANSNYAFSIWSDETANQTRSNEEVIKDVVYEAAFTSQYKLTYIAGPGGTVQYTDAQGAGENKLEQSAGIGSPGREVTATPMTGHVFTMWDDGLTNSKRTDQTQNENKTFTAIFTPYLTLTYLAKTIDENGDPMLDADDEPLIVGGLQIPGEDGYLQSYTKQLPAGTAGPSVVADFLPTAPETGYKFIGWSDGKKQKLRVDTPTESGEKTFTAIFQKWDYIPITSYLELREICRMMNVNNVRRFDNYELMNDIDAELSRNENYLFTPFALTDNNNYAFNKKFRGNGYTIRNLYINLPNNDNVSLFGKTQGAEITGVRLESAEIIGKNNVGGLVGYAENTLIDDCKIGTGTVNGNSNTGGLVGSAKNTLIDNCEVGTVTVKGNSNTGGLAGYFEGNGVTGDKVLRNSSSKASVGINASGTEYFGGLVGHLYNAFVSNCYSTGTVTTATAVQYVGGLMGGANTVGGVEITFEQCHSTGNVVGGSNTGGMIGGVYSSAGMGTPLINIRVAQSYVTGNVSGGTGRNIGGLIGGLTGVTLVGVAVTISKSSFTGEISGGGGYIGGLVGYSVGGASVSGSNVMMIDESYSTGVVSGIGDNIGGLVGSGGSGSVVSSYFSGVVTATGSGEGAGGLVGSSSNGFTITNSYVIGEINASGYSYVGGIIGNNNSSDKLIGCYVAVTVSVSGAYKGTLYGNVFNAGTTPTVTQCFYDNTIFSSGTQGTGKPTEEMKQAATYTGWDFGSVWAINNGYPYLRSLGETQIPESLSKRPRISSAIPTRAIVRGKTLIITASQSENLQVRFYDLRGRVAARYAVAGSARISLARVPSGRYIMELRENRSRKRISVSRVLVR